LDVFDHVKATLPLESELETYRHALLDIICAQYVSINSLNETQHRHASEIVECFDRVIEVGASLSGITGDHVRDYVRSKGPQSKLFLDFYRESLIIDDIVASSHQPVRQILSDKTLDARKFPKCAGHYMIIIVGGPDEPDFCGVYVGQARDLFVRSKKHWDRKLHYARKRQEAIGAGKLPPYARQMLYNSWSHGQRVAQFASIHQSYNYVETSEDNPCTLSQTWQSIVESVYAVFFKAVQHKYLEQYHPSPTCIDKTVGLNVQFPLYQSETFDGKFNGGFAALKNNPDPAIQAVYEHHIVMFTASGKAAMKAYGWKYLAEAI
jgi:hypothetical protein